MRDTIKLEYKGVSDLYKRDLYLNKSVDFIHNRITEYDIKSAGFNLIKEYGLLPDTTINILEGFKKEDRNIEIGLLQRNIEGLSDSMNKAFKTARARFFVSNKIQSSNILSIKRDAIFLIGIKPEHLKFGKHIEFVPKNVYSSYHNISDIEFYFSKKLNNFSLDVKGIDDNVVQEHLDNGGIPQFLGECFAIMEKGNKEKLKSKILNFADDYKARKLPVINYKTFTSSSTYLFEVGHSMGRFYNENIIVEDVKNLNITYNYTRFIEPMIERFIW
jgi:hypothetical protein